MRRTDATFNAIEIATGRLILKPVSPFRFARQTLHWTRDAQAFSNLAMKPGRWTLLRWWMLLRRLSRRNHICHGIWLRRGGAPIGMRWAVMTPATRDVCTSIFIADQSWRGKGIAAETATALLDDFFIRCRINKVTSWINETNASSIKLANTLGFAHEGALRQSAVTLDGQCVDLLAFGMLRSEWISRRGLGSVEPNEQVQKPG